ncbi:MAG: zinc ribbon domain-containing protein [Planctomycetota bacterium]
MPLYEYLCQDCGDEQELLVQGDSEVACESCGSTNLTKLLSVPAAHTAAGPSTGTDAPPPGPCGSACGCFPPQG